MEKSKTIKIPKEAIGFIFGSISGYVLGAIYSYLLIIYLSKLRNIIFIATLLDYLLLKVEFTYLPQLISTVLGFLTGYYYFKKRKIAFVLVILLFSFFIIYTIFGYIFLVHILGPFRDV